MQLLLERLLPLVGLIVLGFIAGRLLTIQKQSVANLLINTITPVVFFGYLAKTSAGTNTVLIPLIAFTVATLGATIMYAVVQFAFDSPARNLIAFQSASGNTGYFGIPLYIALFGEAELGTYVFTVVGYMLFECSIGYYLLARGAYSVRDSVIRLLRLPPMYGICAGLLYSGLGHESPVWFADVLSNFRGAYIVLGMMMIGLALGDTPSFRLNPKVTAFTALGKFFLIPGLMVLILWLDASLFHLLDNQARRVLVIFSIVPPAANSVAYAIQLNVLPKEAAMNLLLLTALGFLVVFALHGTLLGSL